MAGSSSFLREREMSRAGVEARVRANEEEDPYLVSARRVASGPNEIGRSHEGSGRSGPRRRGERRYTQPLSASGGLLHNPGRAPSPCRFRAESPRGGVGERERGSRDTCHRAQRSTERSWSSAFDSCGDAALSLSVGDGSPAGLPPPTPLLGCNRDSLTWVGHAPDVHSTVATGRACIRGTAALERIPTRTIALELQPSSSRVGSPDSLGEKPVLLHFSTGSRLRVASCR